MKRLNFFKALGVVLFAPKILKGINWGKKEDTAVPVDKLVKNISFTYRSRYNPEQWSKIREWSFSK